MPEVQVNILLLGVPSLLASQGPGHQAPVVFARHDGVWIEEEPFTNHGRALPLYWQGAPCYPAIDALVRTAEAADTRWEVSLEWIETELPDGDWSERQFWFVRGPDGRGSGFSVKADAESDRDECHAMHWARLRRAACLSYEDCLEMANEAAPLLGGRVETP